MIPIPTNLAIEGNVCVCCSTNVNVENYRVIPEEDRSSLFARCLFSLCCPKDFHEQNQTARERFLESIRPKVGDTILEQIKTHSCWNEGQGPLTIKDIKRIRKLATCLKLRQCETSEKTSCAVICDEPKKNPVYILKDSDQKEVFNGEKIKKTLSLATKANPDQIRVVVSHIEIIVYSTPQISAKQIHTYIAQKITEENIAIYLPEEI
jgi:transcriptional regulator NrdR family protein